MGKYTIFNKINKIDYDLKDIKLQILVSENLEELIHKRIAQLSLRSGKKIRGVSAYVRELIIKDCLNIKK